jgi:hypothetical protein
MFKRAYGRRGAPVTSGNIKEEVLDVVLENLHNSTGSIAQQVGIGHYVLLQF